MSMLPTDLSEELQLLKVNNVLNGSQYYAISRFVRVCYTSGWKAGAEATLARCKAEVAHFDHAPNMTVAPPPDAIRA